VEVKYLQMHSTGFLIVFYLCAIKAFPNGAPTESCLDMVPDHGGNTPSTTVVPFKVLLSANTINNGQFVDVTIAAEDGNETFRGFFIQARDESSVETIHGNFDDSNNTIVDCLGGFHVSCKFIFLLKVFKNSK